MSEGGEQGGREGVLTVSRPELLDEGSDAKFRDLLHLIFAFSTRLQTIRSRFSARIALSPTQYMVLIAIAQQADDAVGVSQIAAHLHLSGAFVTIEVNKLVEAGLVEKNPHPSDRRRVALRPSGAARDLLAELAALQRPVNDMLFGSLSADDFHRMHERLSLLLQDADRAIALADFLKKES